MSEAVVGQRVGAGEAGVGFGGCGADSTICPGGGCAIIVGTRGISEAEAGADADGRAGAVGGIAGGDETPLATLAEPVAGVALGGREDLDRVAGMCCVDDGNSSTRAVRDCSWSLEPFLSSAFLRRLTCVLSHKHNPRGIVALRKDVLTVVRMLWLMIPESSL